MNVPPDYGIQGHLTGLLTGTESLTGFCRWFVEAIADAKANADEAAWELFLAVENVLAEWTGGHLSNAETVQALRQIAEPALVVAVENPFPR